jgi:spoIIIJ-associated protein
MTDEREFYAATVQEAVEKAADELGLSAQEMSYRVLDEGNSGFLGIGARDARILVDAPGPVPDAPSEVDLPSDTPPDERGGVESVEAGPLESDVSAGSSTLAQVSGDPSEGGQTEAPQELLDELRDLVSSILDAMNFGAGVEVYDAGSFIAVDVTPEDTALFIGQKGETIDALQYLVNVSAFKERSFFKRIVLDAEGYRQRRVEAIQGMAHRTARRAVRERRTVEMPPMKSSERRVVHLYLSDNPDVTTESEGSGEGRRVMVSPST